MITYGSFEYYQLEEFNKQLNNRHLNALNLKYLDKLRTEVDSLMNNTRKKPRIKKEPVVLTEQQERILDEYSQWSGFYHPSETSKEMVERFIDNCLYDEDNEDTALKDWLLSLNKKKF
jgi:hypothetical protein